MFVRHEPREGAAYALQCQACGVSVGSAGEEEFLGLLSGKFGKVLCFECDGRSDEIPAHLLCDQIPYWLLLGPQKEIGEPFKAIFIDPFRQARANADRVDLWKTSYQGFVQDLQMSVEDV